MSMSENSRGPTLDTRVLPDELWSRILLDWVPRPEVEACRLAQTCTHLNQVFGVPSDSDGQADRSSRNQLLFAGAGSGAGSDRRDIAERVEFELVEESAAGSGGGKRQKESVLECRPLRRRHGNIHVYTYIYIYIYIYIQIYIYIYI